MDNIITKIEGMRESGKLTTEQSVDFILQLLFQLHNGQQDIMKVLVERKDEINDLDARMLVVESKISAAEQKLAVLDSAILMLTENVRANSKMLDKLDIEMRETSDLTYQTKRHTIWYWTSEHKSISMFLVGGIILLINFHEDVYKFVIALLGIRLP